MNMNGSKEKLLYRIIEAIYGKYDPNISDDEKNKNVISLTERLKKSKTDKNYRQNIGPLQPANILSQMFKLPEEDIRSIAKEVGVRLPKSVNFKEFDLSNVSERLAKKMLNQIENSLNPEEEILNFLTSVEETKKKAFEFVDLTLGQTIEYDERYEGTLKAVSFLQDLAKKHRKNEVHCMTVITLLKNGKVSVWMPESTEMDPDAEVLYNELIRIMSSQETPTTGGN